VAITPTTTADRPSRRDRDGGRLDRLHATRCPRDAPTARLIPIAFTAAHLGARRTAASIPHAGGRERNRGQRDKQIDHYPGRLIEQHADNPERVMNPQTAAIRSL